MSSYRILPALVAALVLSPLSAYALVNINTADLATLETLNGIGPSKAQAIINYRTQHGDFQKIEDIMNVTGIGNATYSSIKDSITVGAASANTTTASTPTTTPDSSQASSSTQSQSTQMQTQPAQTAVSSYVAPPEPTVFADGGDDRIVIVGADTAFRGRAYDRKGQSVEHVRYIWNFGDGTTADGPTVNHHYSYPGRYAAVLTIAEQTDAVSDHFVVTAAPAKLSFRVEVDGSVTIENDDARDVDLSGWIVRSFGRTFALPPDSIVLRGASIRIGHDALGFFADPNSELAYPNGAHALAANQSVGQSVGDSGSPSAPTRTAAPAPIPEMRAVSDAHSTRLRAAPEAPADTAIDPPESAARELPADTATSAVQAAAAATGGFSPWWLGALGFAVLAGVGVIAARRFRTGEWNIVEESDE